MIEEKLITYKCYECSKDNPCILTWININDNIPIDCPFNVLEPTWVLIEEVDE